MKPPPIFDNSDVKKIGMRQAVAVMEATFHKVAQGQFIHPPRHHVSNDHGALVFTVGGDQDQGMIGFRFYNTMPTPHQQFVTLIDAQTGAIKGLVFGGWLGALRTGAIGGVAIKHLSSENSRKVGLIGCGLHGKTQLMAACAVRPITQAKVYSRRQAPREQFAHEMSSELGLEVLAVSSAEEACADVDILITATTSPDPVIEKAWIAPGTHLNSLGPKFSHRHELPLDLISAADHLVTDSLQQVKSYPEGHFLLNSPDLARIVDLGSSLALGEHGRNKDQDISLFLSVGLAGTEVMIGQLLLGSADPK